VDFGLDTQEHYEALYYPWRRGEITTKQLDTALGDGKKLTALAQAAPSNPHKGIVFDCGYYGNDPDTFDGNILDPIRKDAEDTTT
jgi:hypothetical protein